MIWYLTLLVLFTSFLFFFSLLMLIYKPDRRMEKRLKHYLSMKERNKLSAKKMNLILQFRLTKQKIRKQVLSKEKNEKLEVLLNRSGLPLRPEEYILFQWISTALLGGLSFIIFGSPFFILLGAAAGFMLPKWYVRRKVNERITKFNEGLADMITVLIGSLRAGFSLPQSLQTVVEESPSPIREEIDMVLKEMQYGRSIEDALHGLNERMHSQDLDLMIQAILIQRQVGGNLATILEKIVQTIRDRTKIQRQITTLTAQGRLSGIVIGLLPIILGLFIYVIEPEYISLLFTHTIGIVMLVFGFISGIAGFFLIRKLTMIEV
ncbi:MAG: type II secretion system F family protein [Bacillaceae bacterium]|nr:type II secretion system F family protein [Bacillaceae bacterium]